MFLYTAVSRDKYELPLIVADTVKELAEKTGVATSTIYNSLWHERTGMRWSRYKRVWIPND